MATIIAISQPEQTSVFKKTLAAYSFLASFIITYAGIWLGLAPMVLSRDRLGILLPVSSDTAPGWIARMNPTYRYLSIMPGGGLISFWRWSLSWQPEAAWDTSLQ